MMHWHDLITVALAVTGSEGFNWAVRRYRKNQAPLFATPEAAADWAQKNLGRRAYFPGGSVRVR